MLKTGGDFVEGRQLQGHDGQGRVVGGVEGFIALGIACGQQLGGGFGILFVMLKFFIERAGKNL